MQIVKSLALSLLFATLTAPAFAQDVPRAPDRVEYKPKTIMVFTDLQLSGEIVKPASTLIHARKKARFRSLIRLRGDFRPELLSSLDVL